MLEQQNPQRVIYLADDDEDDRMLFFEAVLDLKLPAVVKASEDGKQLLERLYTSLNCLPEIIFLDINMPGINGLDCLKEIRSAKNKLNKIKIVMLSTSRSAENIDLSYELGADLYAVKPDSFQGLKELVKRVLDYDWSTGKKDIKKFLLA